MKMSGEVLVIRTNAGVDKHVIASPHLDTPQISVLLWTRQSGESPAALFIFETETQDPVVLTFINTLWNGFAYNICLVAGNIRWIKS